MAKSLFWLSDEAWMALSPHLPRGRPGKARVDDRRVISGILHVLKTGYRWGDVPPVYSASRRRRKTRALWAEPTSSTGCEAMRSSGLHGKDELTLRIQTPKSMQRRNE